MDYDLWLDYVRNYEFLQKKLKLLFDTNIDILKQKDVSNYSVEHFRDIIELRIQSLAAIW